MPSSEFYCLTSQWETFLLHDNSHLEVESGNFCWVVYRKEEGSSRVRDAERKSLRYLKTFMDSFRNFKQYIIFNRLRSFFLGRLRHSRHPENFNKSPSSLFAMCFDGRNYVNINFAVRWWFNVYIGKMFKLLSKYFMFLFWLLFFASISRLFCRAPLFLQANGILSFSTNGKVS